MENITRGSIFLCSLPDNPGSVEGKERPCIIVSNDKANRFSPVVSVIPITSAKKRDLPVHITLDYLPKASVCLVEQLTVIDKQNIIKYLGQVTNETLEKIKTAIKIQFAI